MSVTGGLPDKSSSGLNGLQAQQLGDKEEAKVESQPISSKAEMTKSDGTKLKREFTASPDERSGEGVRGSGFGPKVNDFMTLPVGTKTSFSAEHSKEPTRESEVGQDILKEGSAEELLKIDAQENLKIDAKENLTEDAREILTTDVQENLKKR